MPDTAERREQLRADFLAQTARIPFSELQRYFAAGKLVQVAAALDLVEVATELALDNAPRFASWTQSGEVVPVTDTQARLWLEHHSELWAVVADPWVLVQERDRQHSANG